VPPELPPVRANFVREDQKEAPKRFFVGRLAGIGKSFKYYFLSAA